VSFDRAASLAFSTDEQELIFLLPLDPADPAQAAPVRSFHLADGSVRQLLVVPDGRNVQTAATGDLFIPATYTVVQAHVQPDGSVSSRNLPLSAVARVSPDGRWISDSAHTTDPSETATLWDVAAGMKHQVAVAGALGSVGDWSPNSELLVPTFQPGASGSTYALVAPETGQVLRQVSLPLVGQGDGLPLVWGAGGPAELAATMSWRPQQVETRQDRLWTTDGATRDFGLALQELSPDSGPIQVLPAASGLVRYAARTSGTALVWARKCLGLFETVCSYELHRIAVPTGTDEIVAVADSAAPVALSVSGKRVAIAARDGIYVRELP
jgi:hypothetical protein